ncbi:DHH family phosphoesterase [Alkalitalea saponilacus]|uniref:Phosphoesterase RecJ domain-containing protein n=1 Tax=Alkalitalea saponilacus TaxID=889453 RepID=A0A1T5D870_9BACT|nr:bifunctional oligoribonuclease/PAP phosphatase NrnA [Alkalitalea saponilacus]ASB50612.1 DHH family phosphoesterase [Alkalitalea saponilacus]SKB67690.1 phosphoesterase RecJ domain-containing protein [Alkalitalea saponilacus]
MSLDIQEIKRFKSFLVNAKKVLIIPHKDPDGDAIGSSLAWYNLFKENGIKGVVVSPNEVQITLQWMPGADSIIIFSKDRNIALQEINDCDLALYLDFNGIGRTGDLQETLSKLVIPKITIDHHPYPDMDLSDVMISDTEVSSTCELSYSVMKYLNLKPSPFSATCLYTGIMTDTGMLNHNSSRPGLYHVIADLLEVGVDKDYVHQEVFHSNSLSRMRLFGHALCSKLELLADGKIAYIALSEDELKRFDYKPGDTEGLVNYPLSIDGIEVAALITEKEPGFVKISMRSRGNLPVNDFAAKYFSGGGHRNAAGGEMKDDYEKVVKHFISVVTKHFS